MIGPRHIPRRQRGFIMSPYRFLQVTDPDYSSVGLLLHGNGPNGGTSFPDNGPAARTVTSNGSNTTSTAQSLYSGSSILVAQGLRLAGSLGVSYPTGDFTLEIGFRYGGTGVTRTLLVKAVGTGFYQWLLQTTTAGKLNFLCFDNAGSPALQVNLLSTTTLASSTWYRGAARRSGSTFSLWLDGVEEANSSYAGSLRTVDDPIGIGANENGTVPHSGHIAEIRLTGVARAITLPTAPYPNA